MKKLCFIFLFISFHFCQCVETTTLESVYGVNHTVTDKKTVSIHTEMDKYGEWVTKISSYQMLDKDIKSYSLEINRNILVIDGKEVAHVQAIIKGPRGKINRESLLFHKSGGKNIVVNNDRKSVHRINAMETEKYGGMVTSRELNDDELFEVRLEKLINKYEDSLGIGITYHTPDDIDYQDWMRCGTIILYDERLYENGEVTIKNYGSNLRTLKVGDRVGVMKKRNGDVHFFINGYDQGVAKSKVTYPVHGVLDLYGNAVQASIV